MASALCTPEIWYSLDTRPASVRMLTTTSTGLRKGSGGAPSTRKTRDRADLLEGGRGAAEGGRPPSPRLLLWARSAAPTEGGMEIRHS